MYGSSELRYYGDIQVPSCKHDKKEFRQPFLSNKAVMSGNEMLKRINICALATRGDHFNQIHMVAAAMWLLTSLPLAPHILVAWRKSPNCLFPTQRVCIWWCGKSHLFYMVRNGSPHGDSHHVQRFNMVSLWQLYHVYWLSSNSRQCVALLLIVLASWRLVQFQ